LIPSIKLRTSVDDSLSNYRLKKEKKI